MEGVKIRMGWGEGVVWCEVLSVRMNFLSKLPAGALLLAAIVPAWWLGASTRGGQWALLGLSALALLGGTRVAGGGNDGEERAPAIGRTRWWCAISAGLFLCWVLVQALNPSHGLVPAAATAVTTVGGGPAGLAERTHVSWLPSGLATPFGRVGGDPMPHGNAWRQVLVYGGVFVFAIALVRAVRTEAHDRRVLECGVLQAAAFSAVALAHNLSTSERTYWVFYDPIYRMGGPQFPHDNQQVAYQLLLLAFALAGCLARGPLSPFPRLAGRRGWLLAVAVMVYAATVTCRPRSGLVLGTALVVGALVVKGWRARPERRRLVGWIAGAGALALGVALVTVRPLRENVARFGEFSGKPSAVLTGGNFRPIQHKVAWLMVGERPWLGWGGGSYLYLSPRHGRQVPELMQVMRDQRQNHWPVFPHADGDWLEFLVEYGVIGTALFLGVVLAWAWPLVSRIRRLGTPAAVLAGGVGLVVVQALIDPVLRNPAVLGAAAGAAWLATRLPEGAAGNPAEDIG
jgi:O-antigen ligase